MKELIQVYAFRDGAIAPVRKTPFAAGCDLHAWIMDIDEPSSIILRPSKRAIIKTGLNWRIPRGYEVQLRSRSGLAAKNGVIVLNAPGTIDSDFDGLYDDFEIGVILFNAGPEPFEIKHGDRIAQAVVAKLPDVEFKAVAEPWLREDHTRSGGFGSTGK